MEIFATHHVFQLQAMPRKPKHRLTTRKGFWKQLKSSGAKSHLSLEQPVPPEEHLLMEPAEQRLLPEESVSGELELAEQSPVPELPSGNNGMITIGTQVDLEFAAVGIQVDFKPEMVNVGVQVSFEEISSDVMLDSFQQSTDLNTTVQPDYDDNVVECEEILSDVMLDSFQPSTDLDTTVQPERDDYVDECEEISSDVMLNSFQQTDLDTTIQPDCDDNVVERISQSLSDPVFENSTSDVEIESDIQVEATQMNIEDAHMHTDPTTPNRFLAIDSGPSHEGYDRDYGDGFEVRMCKGNDDEDFLPLVCRHKGVFKDAKGNYNS